MSFVSNSLQNFCEWGGNNYIILFLRAVSLRTIKIDTVHTDALWCAWITIQTEIYDTTVITFAELVSFLTDSNTQSVFRFRIEPISENINTV